MLQLAEEIFFFLMLFSLVSEENKAGVVNAGCLLPVPHPCLESPLQPKSPSRAGLPKAVGQLIDCNVQISFY